jgi:hypothetical protein
MKKILIKLAVLGSLVLLMNVALYSLVYKKLLPYYWGSNEISDKREYLLQNRGLYNSLFIGSSKTHNQINPLLFDQMAKEAGLNLKSYNFGVGGLTPMESLHIYENLLLQDSLTFKYAFIELDWLGTIRYENLNVPRSFYWLDSKNYLASVSSIVQSSVPLERRAWGLFHYSLDYTENMLNVGKVQEVLKFSKHRREQTITAADSNVVFHGFVPIKESMGDTEQELYDEVRTSAQEGVRNFEMLSKEEFSTPFLRRLQSIIAISEQRGITPFFVVPLQWKYYQYRELVPVINAIGMDKVLCLFDIEKYKHVYQKDFFADPNHLNAKGAVVYTQQLFENFRTQCDDVNLVKK